MFWEIVEIFTCLFALLFILMRNVDDNGMDDYDRAWNIAGPNRERGALGTIYTNGHIDFWANLFDHNPLWQI